MLKPLSPVVRPPALRVSAPARPAAAAPAPAPVVRAKPEPQAAAQAGPRARFHRAFGAVAGGGAGVLASGGLVGLSYFGGLAWSAPAAIAMVAGGLALGALAGAGVGFLQGTVEDKVLAKAAKNPRSQWGIYFAGSGAWSAGWSFTKSLQGKALLPGVSAIAYTLVGAFMTVREARGLGKGGSQADNMTRLAGAAMATAGSAAVVATLFPVAAPLAAVLVPAGFGLAASGWVINLVGQFMNEDKDALPTKP